MRSLLQDAQNRPNLLAQELGGVPAGGGMVQRMERAPTNITQQRVPQSASQGSDLGGLVESMVGRYAQNKADYAPVNVDWNSQSGINKSMADNMYAQELTNPTGIIPAGSSSPSMVGLPQSGGSGLWGNLKGFFGGTR